MSFSFRPVKTEWGEHSSNILGTDDVVNVLCRLALYWTDKSPATVEVGSMQEVEIMRGREFITSLLQRSRMEVLDDLVSSGFNMESVDVGDLDTLLSNMCVLAWEWVASVDSDGVLRFWID